jgi:hypothetical protein
MPEHEHLGGLRGVTAQQHSGDGQQLAGYLVHQRNDHADMVPAEPAPPPLPAAMTFRARQDRSAYGGDSMQLRTGPQIVDCLLSTAYDVTQMLPPGNVDETERDFPYAIGYRPG